jgi:hypothetical protein
MNVTHHRRAAINGGALGFLIVLVVLTIAFSILTYLKSEESRAVRDGAEEGPYKTTFLAKSLNEVRQLETDIEAIETKQHEKNIYLGRLDLLLGQYSTYYHDVNGFIITTAETDRSKGAQGPAGQQVKVSEEISTRLKNRKDLQDAAAQKGYPNLLETANNFSDRSAAELDKSTQIEDRLRKDKEALQKQIELYSREKLQIEAVHRKERAARQIRISQLESQIRELLELRLQWLKDIEPDGEVLYADLDHKYVMIDRGSSYGTTTGLKFEVFQYVKGQIVTKGMIEVVSVGTENSRCRILEEVDPVRNGMIQGDLIGNPVFSPDDPKTFFLAGEFESYNKADLERFIELMGGIVQQNLVPGIDFMVAGKNSDKMRDAAREYQVIAMTEEQLVKYLTPRFLPLSAAELEVRARQAAELEALRRLEVGAKKPE